ncbi:serine hydrolase domain-containing protein [Winogradskyella algicola]|uniref:serine hydrolase domain-containing protein n=1 Tax=Winogradskyella algicola TaxID=2575815 RepID=UPI001108F129|nr:serine hydrolase domain-containing protein [Winogradskyella algicola]
MKNQSIIISLLLLLGLNLAAAQQAILDSNKLSDRIDTYLTNGAVNGYAASVLVAKDDKIILSKGYGWANREYKIPNSPATVFNIGSVTKQFTAAAIMKLVEQGKLRVSDKLTEFFSNVPEDKKDISIHQLLTHTSGISPATGGFRYDEVSKQEFLDICFEADLLTIPGEIHRYANANYILLAAIIEKVSNQAYGIFLEEEFFKPLNMNHTGYKSINFSTEQLAHGYYFNYTDGEWRDWGTTQQQLPDTNKHWFSIGKGDIHSTTQDLFRWHQALKNNEILTAECLKRIETPYVAENQLTQSHYGYGWAIFTSSRSTKIVTHNGSNGIYFANILRFVEEDMVIIVLSNTRLNQDSENVAWYIAKMLSDENYIPKRITKLTYELVYDFINENKPENIQQLPIFLESNLGTKFDDKAVLNRIGYKRMDKEITVAWGLEILKLNTQLFPNDGNLWDSLGEAYLKYNQSENAIMAFTKALQLAPEDNCHWCDNAQAKLKTLKND